MKRRLRSAIIKGVGLLVVILLSGTAIWALVGCPYSDSSVRRSSPIRKLVDSRFEGGEEIDRAIEEVILAEVPVGTSLADVEEHLRRHFRLESFARENDWYEMGKWHYRFQVQRKSECFFGSSVILNYSIKDDQLVGVYSYYANASL